MKKIILLISVFCVFGGSVSAGPELKGSPEELAEYLANAKKTITLYGSSEIEVKADRAIVKIRVTTEDASLEKALKKNQTTESSIIKSLQKSGISGDRIMTSTFSSLPEWGVLGKKGYEIENVIKIKVEGKSDILEIARHVDNYKEVEYAGISFEHSEKEKLEDSAIEKACDRLLTKKNLYEQKFDVKLVLETFVDGATLKSGAATEDPDEKYLWESSRRMSLRSAAKAVSYGSRGFGQIVITGRISATYKMEVVEK